MLQDHHSMILRLFLEAASYAMHSLTSTYFLMWPFINIQHDQFKNIINMIHFQTFKP